MPERTRIDLTGLVDDLTGRVEGVLHAIVLSGDGLLVAGSTGLPRDDAEHLAAVAAGLHGLARSAGRHLGNGKVLRTVIELDSGFLFVTAAGSGTCLAVLCAAQVDIGLVGYETERLVLRLERHGTTVRQPARQTVASRAASRRLATREPLQRREPLQPEPLHS